MGTRCRFASSRFETRMAILNKRLYSDGIEMPQDVIEYLAYSITTNVRELEGALISILAQSSLNKKAITIDLARQMIDKFVKNITKEISIDYIQKIVCDFFDIPVDLINSNTRKREIVQARQLSMYFSKNIPKLLFKPLEFIVETKIMLPFCMLAVP